MNNYYLIQSIENIKDDLNKIKININTKTVTDLENAWGGSDARNFSEKLEEITRDIKRIENLLDKLSSSIDNYNRVSASKR